MQGGPRPKMRDLSWGKIKWCTNRLFFSNLTGFESICAGPATRQAPDWHQTLPNRLCCQWLSGHFLNAHMVVVVLVGWGGGWTQNWLLAKWTKSVPHYLKLPVLQNVEFVKQTNRCCGNHQLCSLMPSGEDGLHVLNSLSAFTKSCQYFKRLSISNIS